MSDSGSAAIDEATADPASAGAIPDHIGVDDGSAPTTSIATRLRDLARPKAPAFEPVASWDATGSRTSVTADRCRAAWGFAGLIGAPA